MRDYIRERPGAPDPGDLVSATGNLSRGERLDIYRNAYYSRLVESLEEDFKRLSRFVGEETFRALVLGYLARHGSRSFTLAELGREFPTYLAAHPLQDVARLEWTAVESFHAPNVAPFDTNVLASLSGESWESVALRLHPSVRLLESQLPLASIWAEWEKPGFETGLATQSDESGYYLLYRKAFTVRVEKQTRPQFAVLEGLLAHESLGKVCERAQAYRETDDSFGQWFQTWVAEGIIRGVSEPF